jgi:hypothetical protein
MKTLLIFLLLQMTGQDQIAFLFLFILSVIFVTISIKNIVIKNFNGILTSVEEESVDYIDSSNLNNLCAIPVKKTKTFVTLGIKYHGKMINVVADSGDYVKALKEKIEKEVKIFYIKIKFLHFNFVWSVE